MYRYNNRTLCLDIDYVIILLGLVGIVDESGLVGIVDDTYVGMNGSYHSRTKFALKLVKCSIKSVPFMDCILKTDTRIQKTDTTTMERCISLMCLRMSKGKTRKILLSMIGRLLFRNHEDEIPIREITF